MLRPYSIYWWHAPFNDFVKVGYSFDPIGRLTRYSEKYDVAADLASLRHHEMRSELAAMYVEGRLHALLPEYGLEKFLWDAKSGWGESQELFDIGNNDYEAIDWLLYDLLNQVLATMPADREIRAQRRALALARIAELRSVARTYDDDIPF
jgi:hypothetical protein